MNSLSGCEICSSELATHKPEHFSAGNLFDGIGIRARLKRPPYDFNERPFTEEVQFVVSRDLRKLQARRSPGGLSHRASAVN